MEVDKRKNVYLVTGTSSGLGRSFVKAVIENGDYVVATARNRADLSELEEQYPDQMMALSLDVTKKEQIREVVQTVINTAGRIDVLINNAGYGYYGASKCALEGISSALRKETEPLGIKVMVVEPGAFRTDFSGRSLKQSDVRIEDYAATAGLRRIEHDHSHGTQCGDPDKGARVVLEAIRSQCPPFKLILGGDAWDVYKQREQEQNEEMDPWLIRSRETSFES